MKPKHYKVTLRITQSRIITARSAKEAREVAEDLGIMHYTHLESETVTAKLIKD